MQTWKEKRKAVVFLHETKIWYFTEILSKLVECAADQINRFIK